MIITTDKQGDLAIVSINGRVDGATAPDLESDLSSMIREGDVRVLLDCGEMNYISSAGLRVFLLAAKRCKQAGGLLSISSCNPPASPSSKWVDSIQSSIAMTPGKTPWRPIPEPECHADIRR